MLYTCLEFIRHQIPNIACNGLSSCEYHFITITLPFPPLPSPPLPTPPPLTQDLFVAYSASVAQLKAICTALTDCEGFNSEGWIKSRVSSKKRSVIDLYLKQTAVLTPAPGEVHFSGLIVANENGMNVLLPSHHSILVIVLLACTGTIWRTILPWNRTSRCIQ